MRSMRSGSARVVMDMPIRCWSPSLEKQPVGYVSLHLLANGQGQIGLIGVGERARGKGVGKSLIYGSMDWLLAQNVEIERVATQGRNIAAQRLYQSCGFLTHSVQLWHHRWQTELPETPAK